MKTKHKPNRNIRKQEKKNSTPPFQFFTQTNHEVTNFAANVRTQESGPPMLYITPNIVQSEYHTCNQNIDSTLIRLKLPTLKYRRIRGDMIELYKIFMLKYDSDITLKTIGKCIQRSYDTRNHRFALQQSHIQYDMRKFSFPNQIILLWNSLPDYVVSSPTLNTFKARLDRFWEGNSLV